MASKAYKLKSFTDGTGAITGLTDIQLNETIETITKHRTDTSTTIEAVWLDGVGAQVVVTTTDLSAADARDIGDTGSVTYVREQRANGTGAVGAADITATLAECILVAKGEGNVHEGEATVQLTYEAYDTDGTAVVVYS